MSDQFRPAFFVVRSICASKKNPKVYEVAIIVAGMTTHGEFYSPEVLAEACPLYEGLPVHAYEWGETLSHLQDEVHAFNPRGLIAHQVGVLREVKMGLSDGIPAMVAELHLDSDEIATALRSRMESATPPELSVDQRIKYTVDPDGSARVMKITAAYSLDLVGAGAAGGKFLRAVASIQRAGLDRSERSQDMDVKDIRTADGLRQAFPELVAAVVQPVEKELGEVRTTLSTRDGEFKTLTEANAALVKERDELKGKVEVAEKRATEADAASKKAAHETAVEKRITASKIPANKITDLFRKQLQAAKDEAAIDALIADRVALIPAEQRATESVADNGRRATGPKFDEVKTGIIDSVFGKPEATA